MRLSVRLGHDPGWAHRLSREALEELMGWDLAETHLRERAEMLRQIGALGIAPKGGA